MTHIKVGFVAMLLLLGSHTASGHVVQFFGVPSWVQWVLAISLILPTYQLLKPWERMMFGVDHAR
jgi:hypothetical protein